MEVKIEMPNSDDDAAETMKKWMSNHPSSTVLIVIATNKKEDERFKPKFYHQFLVNNYFPMDGLF
jgi:hypothetical protein